MSRLFLNDQRGAVMVDWVALATGIIFLAIFVVFSVLGNSAGYLLDEFEQLNKKYDAPVAEVSALGSESGSTQPSIFNSEISTMPPSEP
jgi:hypothetical protein